MTNLLLCGCEPHGHKCLISEGGCGRCFEHCVCTPSGVAENGAGRAEDTRQPWHASTPAASLKALFIGGSKDGEIMTLGSLCPVYRVPVLNRPLKEMPSFSLTSKLPGYIGNFEYEEYRLQYLRTPTTQMSFFVIKDMTLEEALSRVLMAYASKGEA